MNATKYRQSLATAAALLVAATAAVALTADKTPTGYAWNLGKLNISYSSIPVFA